MGLCGHGWLCGTGVALCVIFVRGLSLGLYETWVAVYVTLCEADPWVFVECCELFTGVITGETLQTGTEKPVPSTFPRHLSGI